MSNAIPLPTDRTPAPRTGHGAASLIPHLNGRFELEPAQLADVALPHPQETAEPAGAPREPERAGSGLESEGGSSSST